MVNDVGFVISKEKDLALGSGTRLDHSKAFECRSVLLKYKKDRETEGGWRVPPCLSYQGLIYFYQTNSHNIHS